MSDDSGASSDDEHDGFVNPPASGLFIRAPERWLHRGRDARGGAVRFDVCERVWDACQTAWEGWDAASRRWAVEHRQALFEHLGRRGAFPDVAFADARVRMDDPDDRNAPQNYNAPPANPFGMEDEEEEPEDDEEDDRARRRRARDARRRAQEAQGAGFEPGRKEVVQILVRLSHRTLNLWAHDRFVRRLCRREPSDGPLSDVAGAVETNERMAHHVLHVSHRELWVGAALDFLDARADAAAEQVIRAAQRFVARGRRQGG
jgi:hypothetical protein